MNNWTSQKMGDLITIKHGFAFKGKYFSKSGSHIVLTPGNFYEKGGFKIQDNKQKWYTGDIPANFILKQGDLIVAMTEQGEGLLGSSAIIPENNLYVHNQRLGLVEPIKENTINLRFVYYLFNLTTTRNQIRGSASGTKVRHTSPERIYRVKVAIPDYTIQKNIADTLNSYDELIKINEKRIKILEEMAQRLYTEWFVKFKFPGHEKLKMVDSELGKIPERWEVKEVDTVADIQFGFNFRSRLFNEEGQGIKVVRIRDILSGDSNTFSSELVDEKYKIAVGDLLIGMDGIFHTNIWFLDNCLLVQRVARVRSKLPSYFILKSIQTRLNLLQQSIRGSTVGHLSNGDIRKFKILIPKNENILRIFYEATKEIVSLKQRNYTLSQIRDLLTPQLVTGKRELC